MNVLLEQLDDGHEASEDGNKRSGNRGLKSEASGDDEWDEALDLNDRVRWSSISGLRVEDDRPRDPVAGGIVDCLHLDLENRADYNPNALEDGDVTLGLLRKELRCID